MRFVLQLRMPQTTPPTPTLSSLSAAWQETLASGWLDNGVYVLDEMLTQDIELVSGDLADYLVGNTLIVPTMSDDDVIGAKPLSVVGFRFIKTIDVNMGNPSCAAHVYEQDPDHTGPRGVLMLVTNEALAWTLMLS